MRKKPQICVYRVIPDSRVINHYSLQSYGEKGNSSKCVERVQNVWWDITVY